MQERPVIRTRERKQRAQVTKRQKQFFQPMKLERHVDRVSHNGAETVVLVIPADHARPFVVII